MENETLYTTEEARQALGLKSEARVRQLAIDSNGAIGRKWGRDWMFNQDDIERMRQRNTKTGPQPKIESEFANQP